MFQRKVLCVLLAGLPAAGLADISYDQGVAPVPRFGGEINAASSRNAAHPNDPQVQIMQAQASLFQALVAAGFPHIAQGYARGAHIRPWPGRPYRDY